MSDTATNTEGEAKDQATLDTNDDKTQDGAKPDEVLGDAGKKALTAERLARAEAERQLAEARAQLKEISDKDKTEAELAAERLAEAEKRATEVEARANRAEVAATSGIPVEVLAGPKSSSAEDITAFAEIVSAFASKGAKGPIIQGQGKQPEKPAVTSGNDWLRDQMK